MKKKVLAVVLGMSMVVAMMTGCGASKETSDSANSAEKTYTKEDVEAWRKENKYTWHELNDVKTIQLIPSDINRPIFRHFGGCAEYGLMEEF